MSKTIQTSSFRHSLILSLGGLCSRCGWKERAEVLKIFRKDGKNIPRAGGTAYYSHLIKVAENPDEFLLLCANCVEVRRLAQSRPQHVVWNINTLPREVMRDVGRIKGQYPEAVVFILWGGRVWTGEQQEAANSVQDLKDMFGVESFPEGVSVYV